MNEEDEKGYGEKMREEKTAGLDVRISQNIFVGKIDITS